jgi:hypothetical protein
VDFDVALARAHAAQVHPALSDVLISSRTFEGFEAWHAWLTARRAAVSASAEVQP